MVVLELELDEELATALEAEAEQFEFETTTAYLHWVVKNRSVVFNQPEDALGERLAAIEQRLDELETDPDAEPDPEPGPDHELEATEEVMDAVDEVFDETAGADDEEISEAIASIEIEDEPDD
jgi:hypothetical protein